MSLLSVDPGIRGCGVAVFDDEGLYSAAYVRNSARKGNGPVECASMAREVREWLVSTAVVDVVLVEWPQVYTHGKGKGDPNDLLALAGVDAALAALLTTTHARFEYTKPRAWKGTVSGDAFAARIPERLRAVELGRVVLPCLSLQHNVWDAVGLGLWYLGRLERRRVFPGASPSTKERT